MIRLFWVNDAMLHYFVKRSFRLIAPGILGAVMVWAGAAAAMTSQQLFARYGDRVLQVRILDRSTELKAGFGSGFVVSKNGLVATNYHVVAEMVMEPEEFHAEFHYQDGRSGPLELVAVDVVNDLALLKSGGLKTEPLELSSEALSQGVAVYALGNPFDLGLTIVEGTYNGYQEKSLYDRIHFTGSINPGMSGGPALDSAGKVIGVNVATAGNQVSFLVPAVKLKNLLAASSSEAQQEQPLGAIRKQLLANQQRTYEGLLAEPFQRMALGAYTLPGELANYIHCWGHSRKEDEALYELSFQTCTTQDQLYLSEGLSVGEIAFRHELYQSTGLDRFRFYNLLERRAQRAAFGFGGDEEDMSRFSCTSELLDQGDFTLKVSVCMRGYKRFPELYDVYLSGFTVHEPHQAMRTSLSLTGVSYVYASDFIDRYLEGVTWQPKP